ncbi:MAG: hypothetical protein HY017_21550 [Betaproteobacteria bacterium]|nr:hypothetical protein [Betaproteobacteria bacterium]
MRATYKGSPAVRFIGVASIVYAASDALFAIVALADGRFRPVLEQLGRAPMVILLLIGGFALLLDKPWSRFVYWILPAYSMIVTLVLLPRVLRAVPPGGDFGALLNATSLYWTIATALLYVTAFIVSNHFWRLEQSKLPPRAEARGKPL